MNQTSDQSEFVRLELLELLARTGECDLATIYRTILGLMGSEVIALVGSSLGRLIREGTVEVETRSLGVNGPLIGIVRLVQSAEPPDLALTA